MHAAVSIVMIQTLKIMNVVLKLSSFDNMDDNKVEYVVYETKTTTITFMQTTIMEIQELIIIIIHVQYKGLHVSYVAVVVNVYQ